LDILHLTGKRLRVYGVRALYPNARVREGSVEAVRIGAASPLENRSAGK
jgi:hypothetical protein